MENKAEYLISTSLNDGILEITPIGELTTINFKKQREINAIIEENNMENVLVDGRSIKGHLSIVESYFHVRSHLGKLKVKVALVDFQRMLTFCRFMRLQH